MMPKITDPKPIIGEGAESADEFENLLTDMLNKSGLSLKETANDLSQFGVGITKTENGKTVRVNPMSNEGQKAMELLRAHELDWPVHTEQGF